MKGFLLKLVELQIKIGKFFTGLPFWPDLVDLSKKICAPLLKFCNWTLEVAPWVRQWDWLFEIELLTKRHPVPLALSMAIVTWRGIQTTNLGHIGTDPIIYPLLGAISGFNVFLGIVCAGLFSAADFIQKFFWPDIYGAKGWTDLNYWGAMFGYLFAYSTVLIMAVVPGMLSRVFQLIVQKIFRKMFFEQAAASADGALPAPAGANAQIANMAARAIGGYLGGFLTMDKVAPITEMPAFLWRPNPDISCHKLEVDTHLKGRAWIGGLGGAVGGVVPTLPPTDGGTPPNQPPAPETPPDIEYTYPDGKKTTLVYEPKYGGYINILTGGLVNNGDIEAWKAKNQENQNATNDWRDRNKQLEASHQDAQSKALQAIKDQAALRDKLYKNLATLEKGIIFGDGPQSELIKPPGAPGDIIQRIKELRNQLDERKPFDMDKYDRVKKVYSDAASGKILSENQIPTDRAITHDIISNTVSNTVKEVVTGQKADGSTSWLGTGARTLIAAATGGTSEVVLTPISALDGMKKYVDKGGNSALEAFGEAVKEVVKGEVIGAAGGVVMKTAATTGKAIINAVGPAGKQVKKAFETLKNSLSTGGKTVHPPSPKPPFVNKALSAAEVAQAKAARAEAKALQQGTGKYAVKTDPKVNVENQMQGMTKDAKKHVQMVADKNGVIVDVRSTTKYAHDPIAQGKAVPKIPEVKTKTINDLDVKLGAKDNNKGLAGYFDPKKPVQGNMPKEDFDKLMKRYAERKQEFKDQLEHLTELKKDGKTFVKDGVVHDAKTGKPFTGDHDVFDIRDPVTGQPLPRHQLDPKGNVILNADGTPKLNPVRERVMKELQQPPFNAQHGAHMDWKYDHLGKEIPPGAPAGAQSNYDIAKGVDKGVLSKHTADGGDALVSVGADRPPTASWFEGER